MFTLFSALFKVIHKVTKVLQTQRQKQTVPAPTPSTSGTSGVV